MADDGSPRGSRIFAIDWLRGLVIMLMAVDHAGNLFDAAHLHGDSAARWTPGTPLPPAEFLTRWVTHLCAPTFILLAGASLALSSDKRRDDPGQTRFIATRGLFIAALDPLWMSLGFARYEMVILQVLYAIGLSLFAMAWLRKLPTKVLVGAGAAIQLLGELAARYVPSAGPARPLFALLLVGGRVAGPVIAAYPVLPWLSIMMLGWGLGRWLLLPRERSRRALFLGALGAGSLAVFAVVRGVDGYGNWSLHRDSLDALQWLHVSKYPPSLSYTTLELGWALALLALFTLADGTQLGRRAFAPLALFGSTAFFFYVLHVHLMRVAGWALGVDPHHDGLAHTWLGAGLALGALAGPCWLYRRYKAAHPNGLTRYL